MKRVAMLGFAMLAGCAQSGVQEPHAVQTSAMCDAFGLQRGTDAYARCVAEAVQAQWREARSARARVNCTPMGNQTVCQ